MVGMMIPSAFAVGESIIKEKDWYKKKDGAYPGEMDISACISSYSGLFIRLDNSIIKQKPDVITNAVANTASSMLQMKLLQTLPELLITPLSSLELSLSFIIGGTVRGFVNGILILLICIMVGMEIRDPVSTVFIIFIVAWSFSSLGLFIGQMSDSWDQLSLIQNFVLTPLSFLGGIFYSVAMLPEWGLAISKVNPVFYTINSLRYATLGVSDAPFSSSMVFIVLFSLLLTTLAVKTMESGKKIRF